MVGEYEKNWAGYTYPAMLRERIRNAEQKWDMSYRLNRRELFWMKARYWLWWRWAPIPAIVVGILAGASVGPLIVAVYRWTA